MDLAHEVGVSPRHLSFVETGRSRPSPEVILAIAERLAVPLRERNALLVAAGYAPRYGHTPLDDDAMARVRHTVQRVLDAHDPYPGVVIDRQWNVVLANSAASLLTVGLPDHVLGPTLNVYRVCLHPDGLAAATLNFAEWAAYLLGQLRRGITLTGDPELEQLMDEVRSYPNVAALGPAGRPLVCDEPPIVVPLRLALGGAELSLFTTLTTFGTPSDVTVDELAVELFYPADDATDQLLSSSALAAL